MPEQEEVKPEGQPPKKKKRGFLGCSFPLLIGVVVVVLALFSIGFAGSPLGKSIFPKFGIEVTLPEWLVIAQPHPELPAEVVFHIFGFPIANSVVASWLTIIFLVIFSYAVSHRLKIVPGRLQAVVESILGALLNFCQSVAGKQNGRRFFPLVATIFLFVAFNAWLGLLPGYGSITVHTPEGEAHLLRPANTDINLPLALAFISFVSVAAFGFRAMGLGYLKQFLNFGKFFDGLKQLAKGKFGAGLNGMFLGVINMFIGIIELLSQFVRIVSFTLRLFGNMTAGEILLLMVVFLVPFVVAPVFYGLELLVGFVQALIFGGLTLIFLTLAVSSHEEHKGHEGETHQH